MRGRPPTVPPVRLLCAVESHWAALGYGPSTVALERFLRAPVLASLRRLVASGHLRPGPGCIPTARGTRAAQTGELGAGWGERRAA